MLRASTQPHRNHRRRRLNPRKRVNRDVEDADGLGSRMPYEVEFFRCTPTHPRGEPVGARLEGFASRRAARALAERRHPQEADGFRIYKEGELVIVVTLPAGR